VHGVHDLGAGVLLADFADLGGEAFQLVGVSGVVIHHVADQRQQLILGRGGMAVIMAVVMVVMLVIMVMVMMVIMMMVVIVVMVVVIMMVVMLMVVVMLMSMGVGMLVLMLVVVGMAVVMIVVRAVGMGMSVGVFVDVGRGMRVMLVLVMFVFVMHGEASLILCKEPAQVRPDESHIYSIRPDGAAQARSGDVLWRKSEESLPDWLGFHACGRSFSASAISRSSLREETPSFP